MTVKETSIVLPAARGRIRLQGVDALRGLAAFWVALSHYLPHWNDRGGQAWILVPHAWGIHAVELFFVISGFVIFMTLEKCRSLADFAVLRFSRIYPAYWATLALAVLLSYGLWRTPVWPPGLVINATLLQEFLGYPHYDNVYWSLSAELAFYLHCAWLFVLGWHKYPKRLVLAWLMVAAAWAYWRVPGTEGRGRLALWLDLDFAPYFSMGILFFDALRNGWRPSSMALMALAIAVEGFIVGPAGVVVAAVIAILFQIALWAKTDTKAVAPWLWMGTVSYSFYLIHRNLGYASLDVLQARGMPAGVAVPLVLAGTLALAAAVCFGVEQPALVHLRRRWERARTRVVSVPGKTGTKGPLKVR